MIRILAFVETGAVGGPAKNLLELARQFRLSGAPVEIQIATFPRGVTDNDFTRAVEAAGLTLHRIYESYPFDLRVLTQLHAICAQFRPDLLQTHSIKSHFLMRLSGEWKRRPWIAFHHGYTMTNARLRLYNQLDRWSLRVPHQIVTVSQAFERDLSRVGVPKDRILVLHNAVDPAWGERARDAELRARTRSGLGLGEEEKALLIVGRLSLEKSHILLIEAIAKLRQSLPGVPVRLIIVGEGPERDSIQRAVQRHGLDRQVHFIGYTPDVLPYYAAADVAVLASVTEGSPNALLEAMVAHLPVVATAVGGVPEIVSNEDTALLVPPADAEALSIALARSLRDPEESQRMAARAHAEIVAHYTPEKRAEILGRLYNRLVPRVPRVAL